MSLEEIYNILEGNKNIDVLVINDLLDKYNNDKVLFCLKELYDIDYVGEMNIRNDAKYRELVIERFNKCIICQNNECNIDCCNVCHILNFADCDNDSKYDINNGLLLCANMHSYFDKHLLKLKIIDYNNAMVSVQIDEKLKDCQIYKYNGLIITLLSENIKYIEKRYSSISKNLQLLE
jgi:hypothetical protein